MVHVTGVDHALSTVIHVSGSCVMSLNLSNLLVQECFLICMQLCVSPQHLVLTEAMTMTVRLTAVFTQQVVTLDTAPTIAEKTINITAAILS